jgi:hypothetical protein
MSDNEHTPSSLRDSPAKPVDSNVLSVKHSVGEPIPEFAHAPEYGTKVPSSIRRQDAGDVLPYQPLGPQALSQAKILEGQVTAPVCQSASKSCNREGLTGGASDKNVNCIVYPVLDRGEIAVQWHGRIMVFEHGPRKFLDLG